MPFLEGLELYRELKRRSEVDANARYLRAKLDVAKDSINRVLGEIRVYFRHFTDHSIQHSLRITRNIEMLLDPKQYKEREGRQCLTNIDLFLLIGAALVHDIGMVVAESEIEELRSDSNFQKHLAHYKTNNTEDPKQDWFRRGMPRLAISDYIRKQHPTRALNIMQDPQGIAKDLIGSDPQLGKLLGEIAAGHGMNFEQVVTKLPVRESVSIPGGLPEECNPRFVALCLRLGDLLDISTARACPILHHLSEPLSVLSEKHWKQYANIRIQNLAPRKKIIIGGTCETQGAERLLREWVSWLEEEAGRATHQQIDEEPRYRLNLGGISYEVKPAEKNGKPAYEFLNFRFNLDEKMVFERLFGKSLYGHSELALRELLQNAIDAQRARLVQELAEDPSWPKLTKAQQYARLRQTVQQRRKRMPITIEIEQKEEEDNSKRTWLSVNDNGIGMTREVIDKYLLKVGRSRWTNDPSTAQLVLQQQLGRPHG